MSTSARIPRLRPIIERLIAAQRDLDRAIAAADADKRQSSLGERDAAALAIDHALQALELACEIAQQERTRVESRVSNLAAIITAIDDVDRSAVAVGIERAGVPIGDDPRLTAGCFAKLADAVSLGYAERHDGRIRITYAGVLELIRADERRQRLEDLQTLHFAAERRIVALERIIARTDATKTDTPMLGAKRAVGG